MVFNSSSHLFLSPVVIRQEERYTLDRSTVHSRAKLEINCPNFYNSTKSQTKVIHLNIALRTISGIHNHQVSKISVCVKNQRYLFNKAAIECMFK